MVNKIRTICLRGFDKGFDRSSVLTPEFDMKHLKKLKRCEYNSEDKDNSLNTLIKIIKLHLRNLNKFLLNFYSSGKFRYIELGGMISWVWKLNKKQL